MAARKRVSDDRMCTWCQKRKVIPRSKTAKRPFALCRPCWTEYGRLGKLLKRRGEKNPFTKAGRAMIRGDNEKLRVNRRRVPDRDGKRFCQDCKKWFPRSSFSESQCICKSCHSISKAKLRARQWASRDTPGPYTDEKLRMLYEKVYFARKDARAAKREGRPDAADLKRHAEKLWRELDARRRIVKAQTWRIG